VHATMTTLTANSTAERFEEFVLPGVEVMLRVARSITRNRHDAEDLVQETMLRAYRSIDRFDGRHPRAWLLTILRNAEINRHRRRRPSLLTEAQADLPDPPSAGGDTAEDVALLEEFDAAVEAAFDALSPEFREMVEIVDLGGLTYAEAAAVAGVPEGTVMSRLHRARRRMRDSLRREELPRADAGDRGVER
jgi:RNA polymerase sigma-70 factor (ECF subfamily)